jgi:Fe-S-cluster containining protein
MTAPKPEVLRLAGQGEVLAGVARLHQEVDERAAELARRHGGRLTCRRGCAGCCTDELTVLDVEAARIVAEHGPLLEQGEPAPTRGCAFLDGAGGCRIYASRPYVCRTQGLPLRWLYENDDEIVEERDICELNLPGPPLADLAEADLWLIGPVEEKLVNLSERYGACERIEMRALFRRGASSHRPLKVL